MLPDFVEIKKQLKESSREELAKATKNDSLLSQIKSRVYFEGNQGVIIRENGERDEVETREQGGMYQINRQDVIDKGFLVYDDINNKLRQDIIFQQGKGFTDTMVKTVKKTGNAIDYKGKPFDFNAFIRLLDSVSIPFDEYGEPFMPAIVAGTELANKLRKLMPQWGQDPFKAKILNDLIRKKREEWLDRESNRKLVD